MQTDFIVIKNFGAGNRLGANLTFYIFQIIYAHYHQYYIEYNEELYPDSIFTLALKKYIDEYNTNKIKGNYIDIIDSDNWCKLNSKVVIIIKSDLISYFKQYLFKIRYFLDEYALLRNYSITFNPKETILIHLRLDDINFNNRIDYNGSYSLHYYANKVNNNNFNYSDETQYYLNNGIIKDHNLYNCQAPLSDYKIEEIINKIKIKNPHKNYQVLIVTSPIGNVTLNYPIIRSCDPSLDLFYLCNCEIVILSRSTFALSLLYFSRGTEFWIPNWAYVATLGLQTNYCKSKFNYFN
jgi:hypothetical protein